MYLSLQQPKVFCIRTYVFHYYTCVFLVLSHLQKCFSPFVDDIKPILLHSFNLGQWTVISRHVSEMILSFDFNCFSQGLFKHKGCSMSINLLVGPKIYFVFFITWFLDRSCWFMFRFLSFYVSKTLVNWANTIFITILCHIC